MLFCSDCNHPTSKKDASAVLGRDTLARYFPAVILPEGIPLTLLCSIANLEQLACPKCGAKDKWKDEAPPTTD